MSLESWKAEFYPVDAKQVPVKKAVAHSLRKWQGLTEKNLLKHDVYKYGSRQLRNSKDDNDYFIVDDRTCALCIHHPTCQTCPITKYKASLGNTSDPINTQCESEYVKFIGDNHPGPMIQLLQKTLKFIRQVVRD